MEVGSYMSNSNLKTFDNFYGDLAQFVNFIFYGILFKSIF